jgi:hypothetical protein
MHRIKIVTLTLDETDGTETISNAKEVFGSIDKKFHGLEIDSENKPTKEQKVVVYDVKLDGNSNEILKAISNNFDSLCLTPAQIVSFVRRYPGRILAGNLPVLFLLKGKEDFLKVHVDFRNGKQYEDGKSYFTIHFLGPVKRYPGWWSEYRSIVVVPE